MSYPVILLVLPVRTEAVEQVCAGAVGELEQAGEHTSVLLGVGEDGVLVVNTVGKEVIIFIHPVCKSIA